MATKKEPPTEMPRTGENEREGWEDFGRKREWFLQSRGLEGDQQSRTQLRLAAIAEADVALAVTPPAWSRRPRGTFDFTDAPKGVLRARALSRRGQPEAERLLAAPLSVSVDGDPRGAWLRVNLDAAAARKVQIESVRVFRRDEADQSTWRLVAESGVDAKGRFAWVRIRRAGVYAPLGMATGGTLKALVAAGGAEADVADPATPRALAFELARRAGPPPEQLVARGPRPPEVGWWKLGPRNINGRIKSLAINPANRNHLLAGSANGGVWISTDRGATWNARWFAQQSMAIGAIAFSPSDPNRVYAATGEDTPGWGPSYGGVGVFRSNNGGMTWQLCAAGPGSRCNKLLVHPTQPDTVYVACNDGLWKSTTGGMGVGNWVRKHVGYLSDALLDPDAPETLYVAEWNVGLSKSLTGGNGWFTCNGTAAGASVVLPTGTAAEWPKLAMGWRGNWRTKYIVAKMGADSREIYYSTNGASTWLRIPGAIQAVSYNEWTNMVSVNPVHSKKMLAGGVGMSHTINRFTWNATNGTHSDHHQVVYDPVDPETCYAATDGGVYWSGDGGRNWTLRSIGLVATQFYSLGVSQSGALVVGGATQDQGIVGMRPGSDEDWFDYHAGNEGGIFVVDPQENWNLYCTPWSHDLRRSTDGGVTWTDIRNGMTKQHDGSPTPPAAVRHLAVRPNHSTTLVAAATIVKKDADGNEVFHTSYIWRSLDRGDNWMARKVTEGDASRVAFSPADDKRCYVGTASGNFYRAKKNTYDWIKAHTAANKPANDYITGIGPSWSNVERVYLSLGGWGARRVVRSEDGGSHWSDASGGIGAALPAMPINSIAVDSRDDDVVYAATDIGVWRTLDAGASWHEFNDGWAWQDVPRIVVTELVFRRPGFTLYASTIGRGVYRRRL